MAALMLFCFSGAWADDATREMQPVSIRPLWVKPLALDSPPRRDQASYRAWKFSLAPAIASQVLDVTSSFGLRELNPMLASSDGSFGAKGAGIKLGITVGFLGVEYLVIRKFPSAARIFTKINWSVSLVTAGFALHNYAIR